MADFCTIMTVVPTGGMDWSPPLGSGATDLCGLALWDADDPAFLVAVAAAVADDAGADDGTVPDAALLASGPLDADPAAEFEPEPPHAASSSTSDPMPAAAANPLLRITFLQFARMTRRAVMMCGPGTLEPLARDGQPAPPTMLLSDILITCQTPPTPLPLVTSAFAPLNVYSGLPL